MKVKGQCTKNRGIIQLSMGTCTTENVLPEAEIVARILGKSTGTKSKVVIIKVGVLNCGDFGPQGTLGNI
jgi:hypothetical protein